MTQPYESTQPAQVLFCDDLWRGVREASVRLRNLRAGETLRLELNASQRKKVFALLRLRRARVVCETALDAERLALHVTRPWAMALAIVTATAKEMKAILAALGLCPDRPRPLPPAEGVWSQASLAGRDCYLLVTGIGIINAAWALGRLAGKADDIEGVVNFGVAGSFDLDLLPLGAAAAVACEIWPEYGLANENGIDPRGLGFALGKESEKTPVWDRINLAPQTAAKAMSLELPAGLSQTASLTVSAVTGAPELRRGLFERYRAGMENMEGFALALGCLHARLPFLEVRTVSNLVGARPPQNWDLKLALLELGRWASRLLTTCPSQSQNIP